MMALRSLLLPLLLPLLALLLPPPAHAQRVASKPPLEARATAGNASLALRVLQLADLHMTGLPDFRCRDPPRGMSPDACVEALTSAFVDDLLELERPDVVVFTGDNVNVFAHRDGQRAVDAFTAAVERRGIPFAVIFGNHDESGGFPREEIMRLVNEKNYSYSQRGPADVDGVGNYMLMVDAPIDGPWGSKGDDVLRMYFLDSGAEADTARFPYVYTEYDWIKPSQIQLYRELAASGRPDSGLTNYPAALMFFHIPLVEYAFVTPSSSTVARHLCSGEKNEPVSSQGMNLRFLSTLADVGEVKAIFVGHDHLNEYCCLVDNVQLCYGGGTGFGRAYGSADFARRARVIEWTVDSNNRREIRSWKRHWDDISVIHSEEVIYSERE